ncbi:MAG: 1-deoxy-D-xylulose-5-phosphate reductoisomerase [Synergistaceae bacterium]|jgi:1-deoxy-D-xylulose-5-phosphate reductoisomerase|nr:1-deoxy-D-xylulose-5-phosphate reductoisomerase [Synergistaceae bacterium]
MEGRGSRTRVAVIGATGSVGGSVLDICARFPDRFQVVAVACRSNARELLGAASRFRAKYACLYAPRDGQSDTAREFGLRGAELLTGRDGLECVASMPEVDHVVFASSGTDAITSLQRALASGKDVSLANKESVVAAGPWVMPFVRRPGQLRPLDSEHSAIWQCVRDEPPGSVSRVLLTASGGPFRDWTLGMMRDATPEDALKHPVWPMGAKITIDSATLMNKGIECIEAMRLFDLPADGVGALIHPSSQVHGLVVFKDATVKLLLYRPDMRVPAAAALAWPDRLPLGEMSGFGELPSDEWSLNFSKPDENRFPCFKIALDAGRAGGAYPPLLIGADEAAVNAFLRGYIPFLGISNIIESTLERYSGPRPSTLEDAIELISLGGSMAESIISASGG